MFLSRRLDDARFQLKRQNKIYFQISSAGQRSDLCRDGAVPAPGSRLDLSLLPRPRALPHARCNPLEMLLPRWERRTIPSSGGLRFRRIGAAQVEHRQQVFVYRHAIRTSRGCRRSHAVLRGTAEALAQAKKAPLGEYVNMSARNCLCFGGDGATSEGESGNP